MVTNDNRRETKYSKQEFCYICKKEFDDNGDKKYCTVQDHCHYTGK